MVGICGSGGYKTEIILCGLGLILWITSYNLSDQKQSDWDICLTYIQQKLYYISGVLCQK